MFVSFAVVVAPAASAAVVTSVVIVVTDAAVVVVREVVVVAVVVKGEWCGGVALVVRVVVVSIVAVPLVSPSLLRSTLQDPHPRLTKRKYNRNRKKIYQLFVIYMQKREKER